MHIEKHIPVIMFHDLSPAPSMKWATHTEHFEAFLQYLQKNRFTTISCAELIERRSVYAPKIAVITFDDCYASVHTLAMPLLLKYGFTATMFMTTDFIDGTVKSGGIDHPALSRAQLQELSRNGFEIGSHACRHTDLRKLTNAEKDIEFSRSKEILEDITRRPVTVLSYPHGRYDTATEYAVKQAGYAGAFSVFTGLKDRSFSQYAYDRLEITNMGHPLRELEFKLKTSGVYIF